MKRLLIANEPKITVDFKEGKIFLSLNEEGFICKSDHPGLIAWLKAYAAKKTLPSQPLPLPKLTPFVLAVLTEMQKIPFGKTSSYKKLASAAKSPDAFRAAGGACRINPYPLLIPCHRVLKSDGTLGGFAYGLKMKERLLKFESSK
jgi:O-6-methylguanine DNA methyltransferase